MTTSLATYTQDSGATEGRGVDFAGKLSATSPLGSDTLVGCTWSVFSGTGTVTGSTFTGSVCAALFTPGAAASITVFKCVAPTTKGQNLIEYITIIGA
jgi:hypothetical protein